ncbi:MAG TPA: glycosyltransferase family 4 protein [Vicinamibacterales bacterium]|nr:glycosyltransferase family 4 protein [Vicinamibacterales bacterium]
MKLAFVVQRYGADIAGGSERHCRDLAQRLAPSHDITVLTSCARDYVSWNNEYPAGESIDGAVRVIRFAVARARRLNEFRSVSEEVFDDQAPRERQEEWFRENGPQVPGLLDHLRQQGHGYDAVLFWTFRYYPSFFGVPLVRDRAVLLPTAEDDHAVHLDITEAFFNTPAAYLFLTPEEQALVSARAGRTLEPAAVIGTGLEPAGPPPGRELLRAHGIPDDYLLYLGRVDRNKGCDTLLEYFQEYASNSHALPLVLAGPVKLQIPSHDRIRALGYVSEELRAALLAHARLLVVPSPYESLGIALLEGWNHGVPALVNARCDVLREQVRRANGGLHYRSFSEFCEALDYLASQPEQCRAFGAQGLQFVEREYRWPTVLPRVEGLLRSLPTARASAVPSPSV